MFLLVEAEFTEGYPSNRVSWQTCTSSTDSTQATGVPEATVISLAVGFSSLIGTLLPLESKNNTAMAHISML